MGHAIAQQESIVKTSLDTSFCPRKAAILVSESSLPVWQYRSPLKARHDGLTCSWALCSSSGSSRPYDERRLLPVRRLALKHVLQLPSEPEGCVLEHLMRWHPEHQKTHIWMFLRSCNLSEPTSIRLGSFLIESLVLSATRICFSSFLLHRPFRYISQICQHPLLLSPISTFNASNMLLSILDYGKIVVIGLR